MFRPRNGQIDALLCILLSCVVREDEVECARLRGLTMVERTDDELIDRQCATIVRVPIEVRGNGTVTHRRDGIASDVDRGAASIGAGLRYQRVVRCNHFGTIETG